MVSHSELAKEEGGVNSSDDDLLLRLPQYYRDNAGAIQGLLRSISKNRREFLKDLSAANEEFLRRYVSMGPGEATQLLASTASPQSLPPRRPACQNSGEFVRWFERSTGARPILWPQVRLLEDSRQTPPVVRVSTVGAARTLAIVFRASDLGAPAREQIGGLGEVARRSCPVGVKLQIAVIRSPLPRNPYVEGLQMDGELVVPWA